MTHTEFLKGLRTICARAAALAGLVALASAGTPGGERDEVDSEVAKIWSDPSFQKAFLGGYGINSDIEPRLSPEDVKVLDKIRPVLEGDDLPRAEAALTKVITAESSAHFDFQLGMVLFKQDRMPESLASFAKAETKFPRFQRAWRMTGFVHMRTGKYDEAIRAFTHVFVLGGGDALSYGLLGHAYAATDDFQAAEAAYRNALMLEPEKTEWRYGLLRSITKQGKFQDAAALLDVLIERFPDKPEFWLLQAQAYISMKQPLSAAANIEALDLLGKANVDALHTLGDIYVGEKLMELAARAYERAIDVDAKQPIARPLRDAELLAARGALREARAVAARVREAWPDIAEDDKRKLLKLEARLCMAEGTGTEEMAKLLLEIVQLDPLDGEALMLLGQYYTAQREPDQAIFYYERAESLESYEANAKIRHAKILADLGRFADAVPLLRRAQEIKARNDVALYLEQIERLAKAKR